MVDIAHVWDNADLEHLYADWVIDPPDLLSDADLRTAVIISLFSDGLAAADDQLPNAADPDRRGWWGDGTLGSLLWLYTRTVWTDAVRLQIEDAAKAALQWTVDDGVADTLQVTATRTVMGRIDLAVTILRDGATAFAGTFGWAWAQEFSTGRA